MRTLTAREAKTRFGALLDMAQREPVRVVRQRRVLGVMVSARDYEAMRAFYAARLQHTLAATGHEAAKQGLSEEALEALLADES